MDVIVATNVDGGWAIIDFDIEAGNNKLISHLHCNLMRPRPTHSKEVPGAGVCSSIETMPLERQMSPLWWGCLCDVHFTSKKPSKWEFFVPVRMDLDLKL